ncbi:mitochondrial ribonuclease P catalytic subunit [Glossina fuscipes]|uniref:Mitochondrial ribonuclease P catalytic subunit n=1 Tax=Glossina fuscipes TaxID=7396 RepID=A0A8U0WED2_9MUSC|nr:mitochondrial ribonuclease P catalytic subunit [Glossina fuscipes]
MKSSKLFFNCYYSRFHSPFNKSASTRLVAAIRRQMGQYSKEQFVKFKQTYLQNRTELEPKEWRNIKQTLKSEFKHINDDNIDATILGACQSEQLELAKNYIDFIAHSGGQPNDATLGYLLRIYNAKYHSNGGSPESLSDGDQADVLNIWGILTERHKILDSTLCENLIAGLVTTRKWREGLELLNMIKITKRPSIFAYTEFIVKAFSMKDLSLGWSLFGEMMETIDDSRQPDCKIFLTYLNAVSDGVQDVTSGLEKMLQTLQKYDLLISVKVIDSIKMITAAYPNRLQAANCHINQIGTCSRCKLNLQTKALSNADFEKLRNSLLKKVVIGGDVFQKSTPKEVNEFLNFVDRTGPYDCVIDGLNVAYSKGKKNPQSLANLLVSVVKHFADNNKYVLVLGRKHMNKWPKNSIQYVRDNAAMFLADNLSQDDPFLLYAALKSGPKTDIFSRDLMRQHAYLLGSELKCIFRQWQQQHQYSLVTKTGSGKILIKEPTRYLCCAHKTESTWHIPFKMQYTLHSSDSFEIPEHWLCLNIKKI